MNTPCIILPFVRKWWNTAHFQAAVLVSFGNDSIEMMNMPNPVTQSPGVRSMMQIEVYYKQLKTQTNEQLLGVHWSVVSLCSAFIHFGAAAQYATDQLIGSSWVSWLRRTSFPTFVAEIMASHSRWGDSNGVSSWGLFPCWQQLEQQLA